MGCVCSQDNAKLELKNEFYQNQYDLEEKIQKNKNILLSLIKLQSMIKGRFFRKNFKKELLKEEIITFTFINTDKIPQKELEELFEKYPPLNDGVEVEVRSPAEFSNKVILGNGIK